MKFKFFFVITTFFRKLRAADEDNLNRKKAAEKASKRLEDKGKGAVKGKVVSVKKKGGIITEADKENSEQPKVNPVCSSIPIPSLKKKKAVAIQESTSTDIGTRAGSESPPRLTLLQKAKSKRSIAAGPQKNIFGKFHSDHESTTEAVLTEFIKHPRWVLCHSNARVFSFYYSTAD